MLKYSSQLLNDGLREFDAQVNAKKSFDAGLTFIKYFGDIIPTTRQICRDVLNGRYRKRKNNLFTIEEVRQLWQRQSWSGKNQETHLFLEEDITVVINGLMSIRLV
ncbi:MAG: hypothetical protein CM15mV87_040 [Caudoviricetes sp.]|nr:MAG: hypothetical protein CM15mV87_040 [Caudoviricetes sp.]